MLDTGIDSITIDDKHPNAGSLASGNITKPSWVSGLGEAGKEAYRTLDSLYGLNKFSPSIGLGKTIDLYYVSREATIRPPNQIATVTKVGDGEIWFDDKHITDVTVLVAAGVWSWHLVDMPAIEIVAGVSMLYKKQDHEPQFDVWAPYKQSISYRHGSQVWFGDGTAIKFKNFNEQKRVADSEQRALKHGLSNPEKINVGYRPYVKGHKNGYFSQVHENTWVSTGGGKNGIVLAAIQARQFLEAIT